MQHSTGKPTKAEQARLDAIHDMQCIACEIESDWAKARREPIVSQPLPTEAHHLVDKGTRKHSGGHMATIPLCGWHHEGTLPEPLSSREMRALHGPSLKLQKKDFVATYGTERDLLAVIDQRLKKDDAA